LLCLNFRIYFSFPPHFGKQTASTHFPATNGHRLCLDSCFFFSFPPHFGKQTVPTHFPATNGHRLCLDSRFFFSFPPHFLFRKKTAPMHFPQQMSIIFAWISASISVSRRTSCFGKRLLPRNFRDKRGIRLCLDSCFFFNFLPRFPVLETV